MVYVCYGRNNGLWSMCMCSQYFTTRVQKVDAGVTYKKHE